MPPLKSNKLIPLLAAAVALVVVFLLYLATHDRSAVSAGSPLKNVPSTAKDIGREGGNWLLGRSVEDTKQPADADTPNETLKTLSAQVSEVRTEMRRITEENAQLRVQLQHEQASSTAASGPDQGGKARDIKPLEDEVLQPTQAPGALAGAQTPARAAQAPKGGGLLGKGVLSGVLADLGFGKQEGANATSTRVTDPATGLPTDQNAEGPSASERRPRTILPMGYAPGKTANGAEGIVKVGPSGLPAQPGVSYASAANATSRSSEIIDPASGEAQAQAQGTTQKIAQAKDAKPYWTIPENATLMGATAMTAIVGRVPVDGRVQDPMQFKLLLGPTNLAANGHFLPPDLSGIVVTGTAIGDMTLSCSEGVIQSLTFVFNDGSIRTVSTGASGGGQQSAANGINNMSRLGFLSDRYGNPCITGKFVTNAPAFLTDVIGLKSLALAGKAAAAAQTTTSNSTSTGTSSSSVTGSKGSYILGETVAGATDAVTDWLTRRMGNTFDAVVTAAGAEVVIHINKEIAIDKAANARKIDYGRLDTVADNNHKKGSRHGLD